MDEKKTYTPAEFAKRFGRERTWAYRLLYAGKIEAITEYGRLMIPASQASKIETDSGRYLGKKKKVEKGKLDSSEEPQARSGETGWLKALGASKRGSPAKQRKAGKKSSPSSASARHLLRKLSSDKPSDEGSAKS